MESSILQSALAALPAARAKVTETSAALGRAQQARVAAATDSERLSAEKRSWIDREVRKSRQAIVEGSNAIAAPKADAGALVRQASALAALEVADRVLSDCEREDTQARQELAAAERRVGEAKRAFHVERVARGIERMRAHLAAYIEERKEIGAAACAGELHGISGDFIGCVTPEQLEFLNTPLPALPAVADEFSPAQRGIVDINMPVSGSRSLVHKYLAPWREFDAALERGELPSPQPRAEAAAA